MFAKPFNQIKNSVRSSFANMKLRPSEPINIPIVTDPYTGMMAVLNGSKVILHALAHSKSTAITASPLSPKEFDSFSSSSLDHSDQSSPLLEASSSSSTIDTTPPFPNSRLFRGSQDEFGFDVYITDHGDNCGPAYLFECPVVLPWDELVVALASESGREAKDIVLSSKFYPCPVRDKVSFQAWLAWSRKNDGPCSTDLCLT